MAADSPNDKRYLLLAFLRPTPICIAVFLDRETRQISLVDVTT